MSAERERTSFASAHIRPRPRPRSSDCSQYTRGYRDMDFLLKLREMYTEWVLTEIGEYFVCPLLESAEDRIPCQNN